MQATESAEKAPAAEVETARWKARTAIFHADTTRKLLEITDAEADAWIAAKHSANEPTPTIKAPAPDAETFLRELWRTAPPGSVGWIASFPGDPNEAVSGERDTKWKGLRVALPPNGTLAAKVGQEGHNLYVAVGAYQGTAGERPRRRKADCVATLAVMLDDIGSGAGSKPSRFAPNTLPLPPTALVETSPGNFQGWYFFAAPVDPATHDRLVKQLIERGLASTADPGMANVTRYGRPPGGVNGKAKYGPTSPAVTWAGGDLSRRYSVAEIVAAFDLDPAFVLDGVGAAEGAGTSDPAPATEAEAWEQLRATRTGEWLEAGGHVKGYKGSGWFFITCPWAEEHSTGGTTADFHPRTGATGAGFKCHHGSHEAKKMADLYAWMEAEGFRSEVVKPGQDFQRGAPSSKAHDILARHVLEGFRHQGHPTLVYANGDFHEWDPSTGLWRHKAKEELRPLVTAALEASGSTKRTKTEIGSVMQHMEDLAFRKAIASAPTLAWLGTGAAPFTSGEVAVVANGVLDLRTRKLHPFTPELWVTTALPFEYDPAATCPLWRAKLAEWFPPRAVGVHVDGEAPPPLVEDTSPRTLAQWTGNALAPRMLEKALACQGVKRSGKGTFFRVVEALVGPDAHANPNLTELAEKYRLESLVGKKVANIGEAMETREGDRRALTQFVLSVTGGDAQNVRRIGVRSVPGWRPGCVLAFASNLPLRFSNSTVVSRLVAVSFGRSFFGKEDFGLGDKLTTELPGILNWALDGRDDLRASGWVYHRPASGEEVIAEMLEGSSPIDRFIDEALDLKETGRATKDALFDAWKGWCFAQNVQAGEKSYFFHRFLSAAKQRGLNIGKARPRVGDERAQVITGVAIRRGFGDWDP